MSKAATFTICLLTSPLNAAELVLFEFDGCLWCEQWKAEVGRYYAKTAEGKAAPVRTYDIFDRRPDDLKSVRPVRVTPTFVVLDDGREIGRVVGYRDERTFWIELKEILDQ